MRQRSFAWYLAPGFTIIQARNAFCEHGIEALNVYADEIKVKAHKGWRRVAISIHVERKEMP